MWRRKEKKIKNPILGGMGLEYTWFRKVCFLEPINQLLVWIILEIRLKN